MNTQETKVKQAKPVATALTRCGIAVKTNVKAGGCWEDCEEKSHSRSEEKRCLAQC